MGLNDYVRHKMWPELSPRVTTVNPSAENIARYFYDEVESGLAPGPRIREVKVWETDITSATYRPTPSGK